MLDKEVKLSIKPYSLSTLPSEHALVEAGKELLGGIDLWEKGKTYEESGETVRTVSRPRAPDESAGWHARISEHPSGSFEEFWDGLARDKAIKEQQYIPELSKVTILRTESPAQTLCTLYYKLAPLLSPRVFTVLQVTHLEGGGGGTLREGYIISVPVDVSDDAQLKAKEEKGVRGRYASVERIVEDKDGKVEWTMATASTPGGWIPQYITEKSVPGQDVFRFVKWLSKNKAAAAKPTSSKT